MNDFIDLDAIAQRIQELLNREGCTAKEFATRCEVSPSTLSQILTGKAKINVDSINKIIRNMPDVDPIWFVLGHTAGQQDDLPQLAPPTCGESDERYAVLYKRLEEQAAEIARLKLLSEQLALSDIERIVIYKKDNRFATYRLSEER